MKTANDGNTTTDHQIGSKLNHCATKKNSIRILLTSQSLTLIHSQRLFKIFGITLTKAETKHAILVKKKFKILQLHHKNIPMQVCKWG